MAEHHDDSTVALRKAAALLKEENEKRLSALDRYRDAQQRREEAAAALAEATGVEKRLWAEVTQLWAPKQLSQLGIAGPGANGGKRRASGARRPTKTPAATSAGSDTDAPAAPDS